MSTTIAVDGMTCEHCEQTVENAVLEIDGVTDATADREAERVSVDGSVDTSELVRAVEEAGYTANV